MIILVSVLIGVQWFLLLCITFTEKVITGEPVFIKTKYQLLLWIIPLVWILFLPSFFFNLYKDLE